MKPYEKQNLNQLNQKINSLKFWEEKISRSDNLNLIDYENKYSIDELNTSFTKYKKEFLIKIQNFLHLIKLIPFMEAFKEVTLKIEGFEKYIVVDIFKNKLDFVNSNNYDLELSSDSLNYIFNNSFGFDTLTVNGCFEEGKKGGFKKATKLFAIENLNNLGIYFNILVIFNFKIVSIFFKLLKKVERNLKIIKF